MHCSLKKTAYVTQKYQKKKKKKKKTGKMVSIIEHDTGILHSNIEEKR
jgi:hypothetical protein